MSVQPWIAGGRSVRRNLPRAGSLVRRRPERSAHKIRASPHACTTSCDAVVIGPAPVASLVMSTQTPRWIRQSDGLDRTLRAGTRDDAVMSAVTALAGRNHRPESGTRTRNRAALPTVTSKQRCSHAIFAVTRGLAMLRLEPRDGA